MEHYYTFLILVKICRRMLTKKLFIAFFLLEFFNFWQENKRNSFRSLQLDLLDLGTEIQFFSEYGHYNYYIVTFPYFRHVYIFSNQGSGIAGIH